MHGLAREAAVFALIDRLILQQLAHQRLEREQIIPRLAAATRQIQFNKAFQTAYRGSHGPTVKNGGGSRSGFNTGHPF